MPVADGDGEAAEVSPDDLDLEVLPALDVQGLALASVGRLVLGSVRLHACNNNNNNKILFLQNKTNHILKKVP